MTTITRLFVALVAGWIIAGAAIGVFLRVFSRSSMDYLGVVAVLLGLCSAGACWWATRTWGPRKATPAELVSGLDVHLGYPFLTFLAFLGVVTFGTMALPFWMQTRRWPKRLDPAGMTLRNGTRFLWKDVTEITKGVKKLGGTPMNVWWELRAGEVRSSIVPNSLAEGKAVLEFLSRVLGRDLTIG